MAAFEVPNQQIAYDKSLTDFQVPLQKVEKDSGFSFFEKIDKLRTNNLCQVTKCKLMSKQAMEFVMLQRQLENAQSIEQLDQIWSKKNKEHSLDHNLISLYDKRCKELQQKIRL